MTSKTPRLPFAHQLRSAFPGAEQTVNASRPVRVTEDGVQIRPTVRTLYRSRKRSRGRLQLKCSGSRQTSAALPDTAAEVWRLPLHSALADIRPRKSGDFRYTNLDSALMKRNASPKGRTVGFAARFRA